MGQMLVQLRERAPAIALRILDLLADLAGRLAFPRHLERREPPARMARDALVARAGTHQGEVLLGVAGRTIEPGDADAAIAAPSGGLVLVMIGSLQRVLAGRMAVQ